MLTRKQNLEEISQSMCTLTLRRYIFSKNEGFWFRDIICNFSTFKFLKTTRTLIYTLLSNPKHRFIGSAHVAVNYQHETLSHLKMINYHYLLISRSKLDLLNISQMKVAAKLQTTFQAEH